MGVGQPWKEKRRVNEESETAKRVVEKRDGLSARRKEAQANKYEEA